MHPTRLYVYSVLQAVLGVALLFHVPLTLEQAGGIDTLLAVVFGAKAAWDDPRVPLGRTN